MEDEKKDQPELKDMENMDLEPIVTQVKGIKPKKQISRGKQVFCIIMLSLAAMIVLFLIIRTCNRLRYGNGAYIQQDMLKYLEKRYGEEFVIDSYRGTSFAYNYVQAYAYPAGYPDEKHTFEIQGYNNRWGTINYYDTYVMVKLTDEYEAYIDPIIGEYFDEYKFYMKFRSEWITNNLPADTKLEDLWELRANVDYALPIIYLFVGPVNGINDSNVEKMVQELSNNNIRCAGRIAYFEDNEKYNKIKKNWNEDVQYLKFEQIKTYLIYAEDEYEITNGGNENGIK